MLNASQRQSLHRAILEAFTADQFAILMRAEGVPIDRLAPPNAAFNGVVFEVLETAERAGWTADLVRAAYLSRPLDPRLAELYEALGGGAEVKVQNAGVEVATRTSTQVGLEQATMFGLKDAGVFQERLSQISTRVCRIEGAEGAVATGFLIGPDWVLTAYHAIEAFLKRDTAPRVRFDYRLSSASLAASVVTPGLLVPVAPENWLVDFSPYSEDETAPAGLHALPTPDQLDYAVLRLARPVGSEPLDPAAPKGAPRGWFTLQAQAPALAPGSTLLIAQHAQGGPLKFALDTNAVIGLNANGTRLTYRTMTEPGSGGAPCFDADLQLVAMHHAKHRGAAETYNEGIPIGAICDRLARRGLKVAPAEALAPVALSAEAPPSPAPILHSDDPQKDRWGGLAERQGRKLSVKLRDIGETIFTFDATVTSTDGSPLEAPAIFYLHDSYRPSKMFVRRISGGVSATLWEITSYGVFTLGAQVRDAQRRWVGLELDLANGDLPRKFLLR